MTKLARVIWEDQISCASEQNTCSRIGRKIGQAGSDYLPSINTLDNHSTEV